MAMLPMIKILKQYFALQYSNLSNLDNLDTFGTTVNACVFVVDERCKERSLQLHINSAQSHKLKLSDLIFVDLYWRWI